MEDLDGFLAKIAIVAVTAVVSGYAAPYFLKRIEQKREEIRSQSSLIDELTRVLWDWRYLAKQVPYYADEGRMDRYEISKKQYDDKVWELLAQMRTQSSKARRLLSAAAFSEFEMCYSYILAVDKEVSELIKIEIKPDLRQEAGKLSKKFSNEVSAVINYVLIKAAHDLNNRLPSPTREENELMKGIREAYRRSKDAEKNA